MPTRISFVVSRIEGGDDLVGSGLVRTSICGYPSIPASPGLRCGAVKATVRQAAVGSSPTTRRGLSSRLPGRKALCARPDRREIQAGAGGKPSHTLRETLVGKPATATTDARFFGLYARYPGPGLRPKSEDYHGLTNGEP